MIALVQTPHRFRTKRQLWSYSGLGIETHSSADQCYVDGNLQRAKKQIAICGLNRNHNHDLKNLFKSAATLAAAKTDPERVKRWLAFLRNHREVIAAMDFFTVPTFTFGVLYCFFVIGHDRRGVLHFNVTRHPTST